MAILRSTLLLKGIFLARALPGLRLRVPAGAAFGRVGCVRIGVRCAASESGGGTGQKVPARLSKMRQILEDAEERALSAGSEPIPRITLDCTSASWLAVGDFSSRSRVVGQGSRTLDGGSGGQGTTTTAKLLLSFFLLLLPC